MVVVDSTRLLQQQVTTTANTALEEALVLLLSLLTRPHYYSKLPKKHVLHTILLTGNSHHILFMQQHSPFKSPMQLLDEQLKSVLKMEVQLESRINGVSKKMYYKEEEGDFFEYEGLQRWRQGKKDKENKMVSNESY